MLLTFFVSCSNSDQFVKEQSDMYQNISSVNSNQPFVNCIDINKNYPSVAEMSENVPVKYSEIIRVVAKETENMCFRGKRVISKYSWIQFVNDYCVSKNEYVACKKDFEERYQCIKKYYGKNDRYFWISYMEELKTSPYETTLSEAHPEAIIIDDKTGTVLSSYSQQINQCEAIKGNIDDESFEIAVLSGYSDIVVEGIKNGKNLNMKPRFEKCDNLLACAYLNCQREVADILLKAGAKDSTGKDMKHCR